MKLSALLLIAFCLQVSAKSYSQKVTMSLKNASLPAVLKEIRKQTGVSFIYGKGLMEQSVTLSIAVVDQPLDKVLSLVFQHQPLTWEISENFVILSPKTTTAFPSPVNTATNPPPAPITVRGRVTNEAGEPVIATITVKGSKQATTTNDKGEFELKEIDEKAILVVTGVGIEPIEIKVSGRTNISINVKTRITEQQEVVVTALGVEKSAKELGYAVTKVTGENLNRTSPSNLLTGLTGKVSGLSVASQTPDMNPQMRVLLRGIRSISSGANNMPLIVLNGSPLSFGSSQYAANLALDFVNNINPNDIEDVTILKGANGTTMYGPEGVNGVILITTKKGNKGSKPSINFQSSVTFQQVDFRNLHTQTKYGPGKLVSGLDEPVYDPTGMGG